ncbi:MAG TPA: Imm1 family immunity protein [Steroidobacteraceae bacterium]|nr:Imm1 family immunity protein [Steroidobacteraceae bacterium]
MQPLAIRFRAARKRIVAETEAEVQAALSTAEQEADRAGTMSLVDLEAANGNRLSILVGGAETLLGWRYAGDVDARFLTQGDPAARGTVPCSRDVGTVLQCPRWALIAREDGMAALNEFTASNEIPACVTWADAPPH